MADKGTTPLTAYLISVAVTIMLLGILRTLFMPMPVIASMINTAEQQACAVQSPAACHTLHIRQARAWAETGLGITPSNTGTVLDRLSRWIHLIQVKGAAYLIYFVWPRLSWVWAWKNVIGVLGAVAGYVGWESRGVRRDTASPASAAHARAARVLMMAALGLVIWGLFMPMMSASPWPALVGLTLLLTGLSMRIEHIVRST